MSYKNNNKIALKEEPIEYDSLTEKEDGVFVLSLEYMKPYTWNKMNSEYLKEWIHFLIEKIRKPISYVMKKCDVTKCDEKTIREFKNLFVGNNQLLLLADFRHMRVSYQFRIHGFFIGNTFYVLKLDPQHKVNKRK